VNICDPSRGLTYDDRRRDPEKDKHDADAPVVEAFSAADASVVAMVADTLAESGLASCRRAAIGSAGLRSPWADGPCALSDAKKPVLICYPDGKIERR
jgi:hypothetical protein